MTKHKIGLILAQRAQVAFHLGSNQRLMFTAPGDYFGWSLSVSPKIGCSLCFIFALVASTRAFFVYRGRLAVEGIKSARGCFQRAFLVSWTGEAERQVLLKRYNVFWRRSARLKAQAQGAFPGFPGSPRLALVGCEMSPHLVKGSYGDNFYMNWETRNDRKTGLYDVLSCRVQGQGIPYPGWE